MMVQRINNLVGTLFHTVAVYFLLLCTQMYYSTVVDELVAAAQRESQPRRWPWQPKTIRDKIDARSGELAALAALSGETLLNAVKKQSQPRRWPWQPKTIRDLINERSSELADIAAERSAALAASIAQRRDALVEVAHQQSQPRRWPWQQKTVYDRVSERSIKLADQAAKRSADLAALAATRRDALLEEARRQSKPRRWLWQSKTARDRAEEQRAALKSAAADRLNAATAQAQKMAQSAAVADRLNAATAQAQKMAQSGAAAAAASSARAKDVVLPAMQDAASVAVERLKGLADQTSAGLQGTTATATEQLKSLADQASAGLQGTTAAAQERVQQLAAAAAAVPKAVESVATTTTSSIKDAAGNISKGISDTTDVALSTVKSAAYAPVDALNTGLEAGKRKVNRGVRLVKVGLWAIGIGVAIGILVAPRSGKELRREIRETVLAILDIVLPPENSETGTL